MEQFWLRIHIKGFIGLIFGTTPINLCGQNVVVAQDQQRKITDTFNTMIGGYQNVQSQISSNFPQQHSMVAQKIRMPGGVEFQFVPQQACTVQDQYNQQICPDNMQYVPQSSDRLNQYYYNSQSPYKCYQKQDYIKQQITLIGELQTMLDNLQKNYKEISKCLEYQYSIQFQEVQTNKQTMSNFELQSMLNCLQKHYQDINKFLQHYDRLQFQGTQMSNFERQATLDCLQKQYQEINKCLEYQSLQAVHSSHKFHYNISTSTSDFPYEISNSVNTSADHGFETFSRGIETQDEKYIRFCDNSSMTETTESTETKESSVEDKNCNCCPKEKSKKSKKEDDDKERKKSKKDKKCNCN